MKLETKNYAYGKCDWCHNKNAKLTFSYCINFSFQMYKDSKFYATKSNEF